MKSQFEVISYEVISFEVISSEVISPTLVFAVVNYINILRVPSFCANILVPKKYKAKP